MRLFVALPSSEQDEVKKVLGAYPTLKSVCFMLYRTYYFSGTELEVLLPLPGVTATGLVHFYSDAVKKSSIAVSAVAQYMTVYDFFTSFKTRVDRCGGVDGYCYRKWFMQAGLNVPLQQMLTDKLGCYPLFKNIMYHLMFVLDHLDVYLSIPHVVGDKLLHVSRSATRVPLYQLMWNPEFREMRVGGEELADLPSNAMALYMKIGGLDHTDVLQNVLADALKHDPIVKQRILDAHTHKVSQLLTQGDERLFIKYHLTDEEKNQLIVAYPCFRFEWNKRPVMHPHAMSASARVCETQYILNSFGYRSDATYSNHVVAVKDVGGKVETHLQRGRRNVHVCAPILDHRDDQRHSKATESIAQITSNLSAKQRKIFTDKLANPVSARQFLCRRVAQHCPLTAKHLMFIHSTYDMRLVDIADSMAIAKADTGMIAVLYSADMMIKQHGYLRHQKCHWARVDRGKNIRFSFDDDSSFTYQHNYKEYVKLFATCALRARTGELYYAEVTNIILDTAFISLTRSKYTVPCSSVLRRSLYFPDSEERLVVHSYRHYPEGTDEFYQPHFQPIDIIVTTYMFNALYGYAIDQASTRFSVAQIHSYARSVNVRRVYNGVAVSHNDGIDPRDLYDLCVAVFVIVFEHRFAANQVAKTATDEITAARANAQGGIFKLIFNKIVSIMTVDKTVVLDPDVKSAISLYAQMRSWFIVKKKLNITASTMVRTMDVATWLPPHIFDYVSDREPLLSALDERHLTILDESSTVAKKTVELIESRLSPVSSDSNDQSKPKPNLMGGATTHVSHINRCVHCHLVDCIVNEVVSEPTKDDINAFKTASRLDVPGDGNCFYHAVSAACQITVSPEEMRKLLLRSKHLKTVCCSDSAVALLENPTAYAERPVLVLTMYELRIKIFVTMRNTDSSGKVHDNYFKYAPRGIDTIKTIYLLLEDQHYTPYLPVLAEPQTDVGGLSMKNFKKILDIHIPHEFRDVFMKVIENIPALDTFCDVLRVTICGDVNYLVDNAQIVLEITGPILTIVSGTVERLMWNVFENYLYERIPDSPLKSWDDTQLCKQVYGNRFKNRAAVKIYEVLALNTLNVYKKNCLDLGGAPGAVLSMLTKLDANDIISVSSPTGLRYYREYLSDTRTLLKNIQDTTFEPVWDVIISDLGTNTSYLWDQSHDLFKLQLKSVEQAAAPNSSAVVKHANVFSFLANISDYSDVFKKYSSVTVQKPLLANPNTTEVYVVLKTLLKTPRDEVKLFGVSRAVSRIMAGADRFLSDLEGNSLPPLPASYLQEYITKCDDKYYTTMDTDDFEDEVMDTLPPTSSTKTFGFYAFVAKHHLPHPITNDAIPLPSIPSDTAISSENGFSSDGCKLNSAVTASSSDSSLETQQTSVVDEFKSVLDWDLRSQASEISVSNLLFNPDFAPKGTSSLVLPSSNFGNFTVSDVCHANSSHEQITMDVFRTRYSSAFKEEVHLLLCNYFTKHQESDYLQGLHYPACMITSLYSNLEMRLRTYEDLLGGACSEVLNVPLFNLFSNENVINWFLQIFPPNERQLASLVIMNLWQVLALTFLQAFSTDWSPHVVHSLLEYYKHYGIAAVLPFLEYLIVSHKGSVEELLSADYIPKLIESYDSVHWCTVYFDSKKHIEWYRALCDATPLPYVRTTTKLKRWFVNKISKAAHVLTSSSKSKVSTQIPTRIGQPYRCTSFPQHYKSTVSVGDKQIFFVGSKDFGEDKPTVVIVPDKYDEALLNPIQSTADDVQLPTEKQGQKMDTTATTSQPDTKSVSLLSKPTTVSILRTPLGDVAASNDISVSDYIAADVLNLETPSVIVCTADKLIRDILVIMVDVDQVKQSLSEYKWHPWVKTIDPNYIAEKFLVKHNKNFDLLDGDYYTVHVSDKYDERKYFILVPYQSINIRACLVKFIYKFHIDLDKYKHVPILQPTQMTCERMHDLINTTVIQSMKHRYQRIVQFFCDSDKVFNEGINTYRMHSLTESTKIMHDNWATRSVVDYKYKFSPKDYGHVTSDQKIKSAIAEIIEYWRVSSAIIVNNCREFHKTVRSKLGDRRSRDSIAESAEGYAVFDAKAGKWAVKSLRQELEYEFCFDGAKMIKFQEAIKPNADIADPRKLLLVSLDTVLMQDQRLFKSALKVVSNLDNLNCEKFSVTLVSGVPGCGKTTEAIKNFLLPGDNPKGDLILFPTKVAAIDFKERLCKLHPHIDPKVLRMHVMTVDSFLINDMRYPAYGKMIIDEALMLHCGAIFIAAIKANVNDIYLIGDVKQIPWINRTPLKILRQHITDIVTPAKYLSVSYRCTISTAALLSPMYSTGMKAAGSVLNDMQNRLSPNPLVGHIDKTAHYLVYTQSDKRDFARHNPGLSVNTIHEYQGKENANITLIRGTAKNLDIYSKEPYNIVALSRHKKKFLYVTPTFINDTVSAYVARVNRMSKPSLEKFSTMSGGFIPEDIRMVQVPAKSKGDYDPAVASCSLDIGIGNVTPYFPELIEIPHTPVLPAVLKVNTIKPSVQKFQAYYDEIFPGNSIHDMTYDPYHVLHSELHVFAERTRLNPLFVSGVEKKKRFVNLQPVLRTSMAVTRPCNQIESLLGMLKRNQAAPKLLGLQDSEMIVDVMVKCFETTYIRSDCTAIYSSYKDDPIQCDPAAIDDWLLGQPAGTIKNIMRYESPHETDLTRYSYMIKNKVKPQLDTNAPYVYSAVQTIAYQKKNINVLFCPIFKYMRRRLMPLMNKKFLMYTDISTQDFSRLVQKNVGINVFRSKNFLEVDISKYDKSQSRTVLLFECEMMLKFGVPRYWVDLWWSAHQTTVLNDKTNGISCDVDYQRKSGDASTFFGNTLFLMALMSSLYDLSLVDFACFAGDDSLIVGGPHLHLDYSSQCADLFNLESKFMRNYKYMNFCSKFFLVIDQELHFVPDPIKLITKLGRHDVVNWAHLEEYRVSMVDITNSFGDARVCAEIANAVADRYKICVNVSPAIEALYLLFRDKAVLTEFFVIPANGEVSKDTTLPKFD